MILPIFEVWQHQCSSKQRANWPQALKNIPLCFDLTWTYEYWHQSQGELPHMTWKRILERRWHQTVRSQVITLLQLYTIRSNSAKYEWHQGLYERERAKAKWAVQRLSEWCVMPFVFSISDLKRTWLKCCILHNFSRNTNSKLHKVNNG